MSSTGLKLKNGKRIAHLELWKGKIEDAFKDSNKKKSEKTNHFLFLDLEFQIKNLIWKCQQRIYRRFDPFPSFRRFLAIQIDQRS